MYRPSLLCLVVLLTSCTLIGPDSDALITPAPDSPALVTDRSAYKATVIEGDHITLTIPLTYTNQTTQPLYLIGCRQPSSPIIERQVGNVWIHVYASIELACLSPPWVLNPGEHFQDTLRVRASLDLEDKTFPKFLPPVTGNYRLVRSVYTQPESYKEYLLPKQARISNTFTLSRTHP